MLKNLRANLSSILWGAGAFLLLLAGYLLCVHAWQDHIDHHVMQEFLRYNIVRGHLEPLPGPAVASAPMTPPVPAPVVPPASAAPSPPK